MSDRDVAYLLSPRAVRERAHEMLSLARSGALEHFALDESRLPEVVEAVLGVTRRAYPSLAIPYHARWRHFSVGGVDRAAVVDRRLVDRDERARAKLELAITSVLLDAGAGDAWRFVEEGGATFARSEGLAVASFHMFAAGAFSSDARAPLQADAKALGGIEDGDVARAFQVSSENPLVGVAGRTALLRALAPVAASLPGGRIGGLYDLLVARAVDRRVLAADVLTLVLERLGSIWPGRVTLHGQNLGDVWRHSKIGGAGETKGLVPFHKLSQWLTYSLVEPLEEAGLAVDELGALTGLPEYRNGGLFVDGGVLVPRRPAILTSAFAPGDEVIVEWRALTVALLDRVGDDVRVALGKSPSDFPLAKVLEGGTWATGRELARARRAGGGSPIAIVSDGTVF